MTFPAGIVDALDPQRLRLLVELKHRGSISAAADACRMGQPSATKRLKTLEAALGEKLVRRDGRASRLTEAGEIVAGHAQRVLDTFDTGILREGVVERARRVAEERGGVLCRTTEKDQADRARRPSGGQRAVELRRCADLGGQGRAALFERQGVVQHDGRPL
jgi:molybdate transport repressor ModE-like protein